MLRIKIGFILADNCSFLHRNDTSVIHGVIQI